MDKEYINSKIECPVCKRDFAKNYILVHLQKQHNNIYGKPEWSGSRYEQNFINIKKEHKLKWDKS
jgi:hypothetical protein